MKINKLSILAILVAMVVVLCATVFTSPPPSDPPPAVSRLLWSSTAVASASTINVSGGNVFTISGTTDVDSIVPRGRGVVVHLITAAGDTIKDGKNLKLNGNFNGTADDVLTLVCDGTRYWYEISRSAN